MATLLTSPPLTYLLGNGVLRVKVIVLLQECDTYIFEKQYLAPGIRTVLPCQDTHKGSLSGAIGSDERNLVTFIDIEADTVKKHF